MCYTQVHITGRVNCVLHIRLDKACSLIASSAVLQCCAHIHLFFASGICHTNYRAHLYEELVYDQVHMNKWHKWWQCNIKSINVILQSFGLYTTGTNKTLH